MASGEPSNQLLVRNLLSGVTTEDLELFFESPRYCPDGGDVQDVQLLQNGEAIVTFVEPEVVDRLVDQTLKFNGCLLQVQRYDENKPRGRDEEEEEDDDKSSGDSADNDHWDMKESNDNEDSDLEQSDHDPRDIDHNSSGHDPCDSDCDQPSHDPCDSNCYQLHRDPYVSDHDHSSDQDPSDSDCHQPDLDSCKADTAEEAGAELPVSKTPEAEQDTQKDMEALSPPPPSPLINKTSPGQDAQKTNDVEEKRKEITLPKEKVRLLEIMSGSNALGGDIDPNLTSYDVNTGKILLSGSSDEAKISFLQTALAMMSSRVEELRKEMSKVLLSERGAQWISGKFSDHKILALLYGKDDLAHLLASDDEHLESARKLLNDILTLEVIKFQSYHVDYLRTDSWNHSIEQFHLNGIVHISTDFEDSKIIVEGCTETVKSTCDSVTDLLKTNSRLEKSIELRKGTARLLKQHEEAVRKTVAKELSKLINQSVELEFKETGIEIKGMKELVEKADQILLDKYISTVEHEKYEVNKPGVAIKTFTERDSPGEEIIESLEMKYKCVIEVSESEAIFRPAGGSSSSIGSSLAGASASTLGSIVTSSVSAVGAAGAAVVRAAYNYAFGSDVEKFAGNISVQVGSLTDFEADVLVNPIAAKTSKLEKAGAVSSSFHAKGKDVLQKEFLAVGPPQHFGSVAVTSNAGVFKCKKIYHVGIRRFRNEKSIELLQHLIEECLKKAIQEGMSSIAFPTLGCGKLSFNPRNVASCFNSAALEMSGIQVHIIAYDKQICDIFISCLTPSVLQEEEGSKASVVSSLAPEAEPIETPKDSDSMASIPERKAVVFHIIAFSNAKVNSVRQALVRKLADFFNDTEVKNDAIANLSDDSMIKIKQIQSAYQIHLEVDKLGKTVRLGGHFTKVQRAQSEIHQLLHDEERNQNDLQYIKRTRGVEQYLAKLAAKEDLGLPDYWSHYKQYNQKCDGSKRTLVPPSTELYKAVEAMVMGTWDSGKVGLGNDAINLKHSSIVIKNIFIVENLSMFHNYLSKLKTFSYRASRKAFKAVDGLLGEAEIATKSLTGAKYLYDRLVSEVNEHYLLHGTSHVETIVRSGIDSRFCGERALFGKGAYFAERSTKADQYADSKTQRKPNGQLMYMFIARVLLGEPFICQKDASFRKPPCHECQSDLCEKSDHQSCDSVIGTHKNATTRLLFREFIVYHPDQTYPEFMVEYVRQ